MPRLVALTMLSLLTIPAAAIVYFLVIMVCYEVFDYSYRSSTTYVIWGSANLLSFLTLAGGFMLIWWRRVVWTGQTAILTGAVTLAAVVGSVLCSIIMIEATGITELGLFTGALLGCLGWTIAICLTWQQPKPLEERESTDRREVRCQECNYSMRGLQSTRCPECGKLHTLDALLAATDAPGDLR